MAGNAGIVTALKRGRSSSEIIQQFNAVNAKILAALLVVCLVCYHGVLRLMTGSDSCQWLLSNGRFHSDQNWQPYGCMLHQYSLSDANQCFRSTMSLNNIMFIGDSRIRELYRSFTEHIHPKAEPVGMTRNEFGELDHKLENLDERPPEKAHYDMSFVSNDLNVKLSNYWSPILNESFIDLFKKLSSNKGNIPRIVVAGTGTWEIKSTPISTEISLKNYKENLHLLLQVLDHWPDNSTKFIWKLQDPVDPLKLSPDRQIIRNDVIDAFNNEAVKVLKHSRFQIWSSSRLITESLSKAHKEDGLHIGTYPLKHHVQILLNMYCNGLVEHHDGTCCRTAEAATGLQLVTFTVLLLCFVLTVTWLAIQSFRRRRKQRLVMAAIDSQLEEAEEPRKDEEKNALEKNGNSDAQKKGSNNNHSLAKKNDPDWQVLITSLGKMGLIMVYFYICDRTNCFMKENKHYSAMNFWLPVGYVFALGMFFNEKSRSTRILHRDQTDEWKGWMQLVILIYHMTGASRIVPLYMQIRVLVSSYLFLTGYGHFCYFWNGGSASFVRFCQVLFRMNLMTVVICLCMNRPYQSYYFVPLVTFWYVVVYLTLVLPPQITSALCESKPISYLYIILKFVGLFACITILFMSEVFFENIFLTRPWKALFVTPDDQVHEWWFRWSLDRYSICFGMVFGFLYVNAQKYGIVDDSVTANLWQRGKMAFVVVLSLAGLSGYTAFTFTCQRKPECNEVHAYIAFVPIISFIMLRNAFGAIRVRYSSFFAWFGRISLELFIGQYHIWLAADTHGVLVLIPNYPVLNVIVTSYILVCVAHEIHLITGQLVSLAVPSDWKRTLRNFVLFFLALIPIAVHDGML